MLDRPKYKVRTPEARYSRKRHFEWTGDKVRVSETEDAGSPHMITNRVATSRHRTDDEELASIPGRLEQRACKPAEQYVDAGYMSRPILNSSQKNEIDLIGPLPNFVTPRTGCRMGSRKPTFKLMPSTTRSFVQKVRSQKPLACQPQSTFSISPEDLRSL